MSGFTFGMLVVAGLITWGIVELTRYLLNYL